MAIEGMGTARWVKALDHLELLAQPVAEALTAIARQSPELTDQAVVAAIEPAYADTQSMTDHYQMDLALSCNCVLVAGKRAGEERIAAAVVRATTHADVNHVIKNLLDGRKSTF